VAPTLFQQIRDTCAAIAAGARHVHIDARHLPLELSPPPPPEPACTAMVVTLGAIAFGSGWFPQLRKEPGLSGARTLDARWRARGPTAAGELVDLTPADCGRIFGQDPEGPVADLLALLTRSLSDLGRFLLDRFDGSFEGLVEEAGSSAERLVGLLAEMPLYRDVPFYKRAQLTAADLAHHGLARFDDLDRLTLFADNLVPHVLRVDGVLHYDDTLTTRIDAEEPLEAGSDEEVEIRACALHAVELLSRETGVPPYVLDERLWWRGQQPLYKAVPRHRCRTPFY